VSRGFGHALPHMLRESVPASEVRPLVLRRGAAGLAFLGPEIASAGWRWQPFASGRGGRGRESAGRWESETGRQRGARPARDAGLGRGDGMLGMNVRLADGMTRWITG
jgi:hypothetical protein